MAGTLKPNGVGLEASYTVNAYREYRIDNTSAYVCPLFNGVQGYYYSGYNSFYWMDLNNYGLDVTVDSSFNIWAIGDISYPSYSSMLTVKQWDGSAWQNYNGIIVQRATNSSTWTKICSNFPSGRYRFYSNGGIDGEWYIESLMAPDKILIKNGVSINSEIMSIKTGMPVSMGKTQNDLTEDDYATNGITSSFISSSIINLLNTQFEILSYSDATIISKNNLVTAVPNNKLILAKGDINLSSANAFNSVTLTANITGNSSIKMIVSVDSGITWKTFTNTEWVNINPTLEEVNNNGMTKDSFNAITKGQWDLLLSTTPSKIRFGYLLNQTLSNESCNTDSIAINIDMVGSWEEQLRKTDYTQLITGKNGNVITIQLLSSGDFKINY